MSQGTIAVPTSDAATAFEAFKQETGISLPSDDCHASALLFVNFCLERGIPAEHVFVEFNRGRQIVEHYMAWFPEEQLAYDLAPHNAFKGCGLREQLAFESQGAIPAADATHVVYAPWQIRRLNWVCGMNGVGWPGLKPESLEPPAGEN